MGFTLAPLEYPLTAAEIAESKVLAMDVLLLVKMLDEDGEQMLRIGRKAEEMLAAVDDERVRAGAWIFSQYILVPDREWLQQVLAGEWDEDWLPPALRED